MNYSQYFAIEKKMQQQQGSPVDRKQLIHDFTNGKKDSLKELTVSQYKQFIIELNKMTATPEDDIMQKRRRKLIALFRNMNYEQDGKADMDRINQWCVNYGKYHKPLNAHDSKEIGVLIDVVKTKVLPSYLKGVFKNKQ